jgi:hypothetical protein
VSTLVAMAIACSPRAAPRGPKSDDAVVVLKSNVRDAQVYIDGRFVAPLNALRGGVALAAGAHRLELRHEDYFSSYLELELARAERRTVALDLAAILP